LSRFVVASLSFKDQALKKRYPQFALPLGIKHGMFPKLGNICLEMQL
jgi:hypothetical protein